RPPLGGLEQHARRVDVLGLEEPEHRDVVLILLLVQAIVDGADAADDAAVALGEKQLDLRVLEEWILALGQPLALADPQRRHPVRIVRVALVGIVDESREIAPADDRRDRDRGGHAAIMVHSVWTTERLALAYFLYLAVVCWLRPLGRARQVGLTLVALVASVAV